MNWLKKLFGIHKHNYTIPVKINGIMFLQCDYRDGDCNCFDLHPDQIVKDEQERKQIDKMIEDYQKRLK